MVLSKKLTDEEIEALFDGLADGSLQVGQGVGQNLEARPFSFVGDDGTLLGDFHALHGISDRFSRFSKSVLQSYMRYQPRITPFPPEVKTFDEYTSGMEAFQSLNLVKSDRLKGSVLLTMPPKMISFLVHRYFGGNGDIIEESRNEFTPMEERINKILAEKLLLKVLSDAWDDVLCPEFSTILSETNPAFLIFCEMSDLVIITSFAVHLHDADTMVIDIVYPFHALKPLASVLRSQMFLRSSEISSAWKDALHDAVMDIPLEVRSRLAETCITMNQLLDIQNDMIIPLPAIEGVDIYLNGQRQMRGVLGQKGTQAAIEITEILYLQNENGMTE